MDEQVRVRERAEQEKRVERERGAREEQSASGAEQEQRARAAGSKTVWLLCVRGVGCGIVVCFVRSVRVFLQPLDAHLFVIVSGMRQLV